jgi:hypothetical protein
MLNSNEELDKKWGIEFSEFIDSLNTDHVLSRNNRTRADLSLAEEGYVLARKKAQEEIEKVIENCKQVCSETIGLRNKVQILKEELNHHKANAQAAIEDALEGRSILILVRNKIAKRDKLLEKAYVLINANREILSPIMLAWCDDYEELKK